MIDTDIFAELQELIPSEQWPLMLNSLFAADSGDVDQLVACLHRGDRTAIGDQAHKLKGASLLMGLSALGQAAMALENTARRGQDPIDANDWAQRLQSLAKASHEQALALISA